MSLIQLRRPWTEQPQFADPDPNNRFGIVGGLLHTASEFPARSFADDRQVTPSAGTLNSATVGMRPVPTPYGLAGRMYDDAVSARWVYWSQPALNSKNFTFLVRLNVRRSLSSYQLVACRAGTAADGTTIPLWITSSGTWDMRLNGTDYTAAGTASQNVWYDVEIVSSAAGATLYVNGSAVITGGAATAGTLPTVFSFGGCAGTTNPLGADAIDLSYCLFANRALSVGELSEVRGNPWQLFAPRTIFIPLAAAAGGGLPTLSNARATSITTTTAVPVVDYAY